MIKVVSNYIHKNLFYVSVFVMGLVSLVIGIFYALLKNKMFEVASNDFLEGTGVLSSYITMSTDRPNAINYFLIGLLGILLFFFVICFILKKYLKKSYLEVFNLFGILNVVLLGGFILGFIFINVSIIFTLIFLLVIMLLYLFCLYICLDKIFKLSLRKKIISLLIFILPVIVILIILKLFV